MDDNKLKEILKLLVLQKKALTDLALELATPIALRNGVSAGINAQKAIIFRAKIEEQVRGLAAQREP
jgi:hypothetical protein